MITELGINISKAGERCIDFADRYQLFSFDFQQRFNKNNCINSHNMSAQNSVPKNALTSPKNL